MDKTQFWQLIEASKNKLGDREKQAAKLGELLVELDGEEILNFDDVFNSLVLRANTADLWGVYYIINGYSSERFAEFRFWLVGQGQEFFEVALRNPEGTLVELEDEDKDCFWLELDHVSSKAYKRKTGVPMYEVLIERQSPSLACFLERFTSPMGIKWKDEEELKARFPRLCEKFG